MMDRRRQPYVAVDVWLLFSTTCDRLLSKFGPVGPLAWVGLLAAAKRAPIHGVVSCVNEIDFWAQVGVPEEHRPDMTMEALLTLLGQLKQTSRTPSGRRLDIRISHFEAWQTAPKSFREAERKRSKRAQNTADDEAPIDSRYSADTAPETRRDDKERLPKDQRGRGDGSTTPQQAASPSSNGRVPKDNKPAYNTQEHHKHYDPDRAAQYARNVGADFTPPQLEQDLHAEFKDIPHEIAANLATEHAGIRATPPRPPAASLALTGRRPPPTPPTPPTTDAGSDPKQHP